MGSKWSSGGRPEFWDGASSELGGLPVEATTSSITGTIAQDHKPLEQSASGGVYGTGTIAENHQPFEQVASGSVTTPITGTISQTVNPLEQSASATVSISATIAQTHQPLEQAASGTVSAGAATGTIAQTHQPLEQSASGGVYGTGTIAQTHQPLEQSASAAVSTSATVAQTINPLEQSASGTVSAGAATGTITQEHRPLEQAASGGVYATGTISQEIKPFEQEATGTVLSGVTGVISQEHQPFEQEALGAVTGAGDQPEDGGSTGGRPLPSTPEKRIPRKRAKRILERLKTKAKKKEKLTARQLTLLERIESQYPDDIPEFLRAYLLGVYIPQEVEIPLPERPEYLLDTSWQDIPPPGIFGTPLDSPFGEYPSPYQEPKVELAEIDEDEDLLIKLADAEDDIEIVMALA